LNGLRAVHLLLRHSVLILHIAGYVEDTDGGVAGVYPRRGGRRKTA
jgi:hypothetical protein